MAINKNVQKRESWVERSEHPLGVITRRNQAWNGKFPAEKGGSGLLIDLIEGPEFRRGRRDWIESASEELEAIDEKQAPKLL